MNWISQLMYSPEEKQTLTETERLRQLMQQQQEMYPVDLASKQLLLQEAQRVAAQNQQMQPFETMKGVSQAVGSPHQAVQSSAFEQAMRQAYPNQPYNPAAGMKIASQYQPGAQQRAESQGTMSGQLEAQAGWGADPLNLLRTRLAGELQQIQTAASARGQGAVGRGLEGVQSDVSALNMMSDKATADAYSLLNSNDLTALTDKEWELYNMIKTVSRARDMQRTLLPPGVSASQVDMSYAPILGNLTMWQQRLRARRERLQQMGRTTEGFYPKGEPETMLLP